MGFTFKNFGVASAASDTCNVTLTGTSVSAGDLIVAWCGWAQTESGSSFTDSGGSIFLGAGINTGGPWTDVNGQFIYCLSSVATGLPTYTLTKTGTLFPMFYVFVYTPTATPVLDQQIYSAGLGGAGSTSPDSGSITTTGSDELVVGGLLAENDATPVTAYAIGGVGAGPQIASFQASAFTIGMWSGTTTGTVNATATLNLSEKWLSNAISFKISGGGGGGGQAIYISSQGIPVRGAARTRVIYG